MGIWKRVSFFFIKKWVAQLQRERKCIQMGKMSFAFPVQARKNIKHFQKRGSGHRGFSVGGRTNGIWPRGWMAVEKGEVALTGLLGGACGSEVAFYDWRWLGGNDEQVSESGPRFYGWFVSGPAKGKGLGIAKRSVCLRGKYFFIIFGLAVFILIMWPLVIG